MTKDPLDEIFVEKSNLQKRREDAIKEVVKSFGYPLSENEKIISFWELAMHLNNLWYAVLFVDKKYSEKAIRESKFFSVPPYRLCEFRSAVKFAISKMDNAKVLYKKHGVEWWYSIKLVKVE